MAKINEAERATQDRVFDLFRSKPCVPCWAPKTSLRGSVPLWRYRENIEPC